MPNNTLKAGWMSLEGGIDNGLPPYLIADNQCSLAFNTSFRGGTPHPRPGVAHRILSFDPKSSDESNFKTGLFQGAEYFAPTSQGQVIIVSISGRIFRIDPVNSFTVTDISIPGDLNSSILDRVWFASRYGYCICQDGQDAPFIFNGTTSMRPTNEEQMPVGKAMTFAFGRLWISNGLQYWGGDILGGPTEVTSFTENTFLSEGGSFYVDSPQDEITAMKPVANLNTALGTSDIAIYTPSGMWLNSVPPDRTTWKDLNYPIQRQGLSDNGALSDRGVVSINSDHWFRSEDGLRSAKMAVRYFDQWGNIPQSGELTPILDNDDQLLLSYGSGVLFGNRLIQTVSPAQCPNGIYHRGLVILDFELVSRLRTQLPPAWEGIWICGRILQILTGRFDGEKRCFIFVSNCQTNEIELWELGTDDKHTDNWESTQDKISWGQDYKSYNFKDPTIFKKLESSEVYVSNLEGRVYFNMKYRSGKNPCLNNWHQWSEEAKMLDCSPGANCNGSSPYQAQARGPMRLPMPPDTCDPTNNRLMKTAYEFQPCLRMLGYCNVTMIELESLAIGKEPLPSEPCLTDADQKELRCCPANPFDDGVFNQNCPVVHSAITEPIPPNIP